MNHRPPIPVVDSQKEATEMDAGLLVPRIVVGLLLVGHGAQKLFGWFGGGGLSGTARFFRSVGYWPPRLLAGLTGGAELIGGLSLAAGFMTHQEEGRLTSLR